MTGETSFSPTKHVTRALRQLEGPVIAPMTLVVPEYFDEIVGSLSAQGHRVEHFALVADRSLVLRRLRERVAGRLVHQLVSDRRLRKHESFAIENLDRCLDALASPKFAEQIRTDQLSIPEVADTVASRVGLQLRPSIKGAFRQHIVQAWTTAQHIRLR